MHGHGQAGRGGAECPRAGAGGSGKLRAEAAVGLGAPCWRNGRRYHRPRAVDARRFPSNERRPARLGCPLGPAGRPSAHRLRSACLDENPRIRAHSVSRWRSADPRRGHRCKVHRFRGRPARSLGYSGPLARRRRARPSPRARGSRGPFQSCQRDPLPAPVDQRALSQRTLPTRANSYPAPPPGRTGINCAGAANQGIADARAGGIADPVQVSCRRCGAALRPVECAGCHGPAAPHPPTGPRQDCSAADRRPQRALPASNRHGRLHRPGPAARSRPNQSWPGAPTSTASWATAAPKQATCRCR